jgi:hypothetical protein
MNQGDSIILFDESTMKLPHHKLPCDQNHYVHHISAALTRLDFHCIKALGLSEVMWMSFYSYSIMTKRAHLST